MSNIKKGVRLEGVSKIYMDPKTNKPFKAVDNIFVDIKPGDFVTLLGPSGCGKTTTLRMIAGFESPDEGEIYLGDQAINELTPNKRDTAMVFQSYALFPHLNIFDNVAYGLKLRKVPKAEMNKRIERILDLVELTGMESRMTNQLSGGQQQRVAIARALALKPDILCFDEPTSALDPELTGEVLKVIKSLADSNTTMIVVTHEMTFARDVANKIIFMDEGKILEEGSPEDIFENPKHERVREFIGGIGAI